MTPKSPAQWRRTGGLACLRAGIGLAFFVPAAVAGYSVYAGQGNRAPTGETDAAADLKRMDLTFVSDGIVLAASIVAPHSAAKWGAVFLPGSGPATRRTAVGAANAVARRGVAVLLFDKRGSGQSRGDWAAASLDDLAADAIAAAAALSRRSGLPATRIGFITHSQGGWAAMRSMELGARPAFVAALAGGGLAPHSVERFQYADKLRRAGVSADDFARGMALVDRYFEFLAGASGRTEFVAAADASGLKDILGFPMPSRRNRAAWAWVATYDPRPAIAGSAAPILAILGGRDRSEPFQDAVAAWTGSMAKSRSKLDLVIVIPDADHHLQTDGANRGHHGGLSADGDLWDRVAAWLATLDAA